MNTSLQFIGHGLTLVGRWVKPSRTMIRAGGWALLVVMMLECRAWGFAHSWDIGEIYSNSDGSVQFIELTNNSSLSGEVFLSGLVITCSSALATNSFNFPSNLSGSSLNKTFLIGTANLASVPGGVTPNYVVAANFLLPDSGTVKFAVYDSVIYTNLPSDGTASMVRSGGSMVLSVTNSPKNFNNVSNSIVPVKIQSISQSGTDFLLSFATATGTNGTAGPNYAVEYNNALTNTGWTTLTNVAGVGAITNVTDVGPSDLQRFYRLRVP